MKKKQDKMKIVILFLAVSLSQQSSIETHSIHKRSLWNFGKIIQCAQGINSWFPFWAMNRYIDYGCHCGYSGSGRIIDETDKCCYLHDKCYAKVRKTFGKGIISIFVDSLNYECKNKQVNCKDDNLAKKAICDCDRECAECIAKCHHTYKDEHYGLETEHHCH